MDVLMPKLGLTMTEGALSAWLVADGDRVAVGQAICEIETDKAVQEILAEAEGVLRRAVPVDAIVPAGGLLGRIE
jgi:pyruvate/2-oxoglutarate dehydrogenase complex dihydrolipoamide acyltransferase (E2) component